MLLIKVAVSGGCLVENGDLSRNLLPGVTYNRLQEKMPLDRNSVFFYIQCMFSRSLNVHSKRAPNDFFSVK